MKTKSLKAIVDVLMFLTICALAGTGLLIHYRLIPGFRGGHGLSLLGLTRHAWGSYHLYAAYALLGLVTIHLVLNMSFIKNTIAMKKNWIMVLLCLIGILVIGFFMLMPIQRKSEGIKGHRRRGRDQQANNFLHRTFQPAAFHASA